MRCRRDLGVPRSAVIGAPTTQSPAFREASPEPSVLVRMRRPTPTPMRGFRGKFSRFPTSVSTVENEVKDHVSLRGVQLFAVGRVKV